MTRFGVAFFPTDYSIQPVELARALEERALDSLFVTEHTHIPTSRETPWPGGSELPREYAHTHDPFVALAAAAAVTTKLRLGTGISDPTRQGGGLPRPDFRGPGGAGRGGGLES